MKAKKNILVAPLNWGLGHATRCIPIIKALLDNGFTPVLASDGESLMLLKKEFPELTHISLPSYKISYSKKGQYFKLKMLFNFSRIFKAIIQEKKALNNILKEHQIKGIISDNRFGLHHTDIPSVFITHQLNVLSGKTTKISSKIHQQLIKKFDICWVPDTNTSTNLSGKMGHLEKKSNLKVVYIGPLSRFKKTTSKIKYDFMILLSGPEPQRAMLETKLISIFKNTEEKVLFVKGKISDKQETFTIGPITFYNYMTSKELEIAINESELIIARSGYTTIMDLVKLEKKAFFIPTPGQTEQEYLAKRLEHLRLAPYANQKELSLKKINQASLYSGLTTLDFKIDYEKLFRIFKD